MQKTILSLVLSLSILAPLETNAWSWYSTEKKETHAQKVILREMQLESFKAFKDRFIEGSVENRMKSDRDTEEVTRTRAIKEFSRNLPLGLETPNNFIYDIIAQDTGKKVGTVWFLKYTEGENPIFFLFDIRIFEEFQNQGYGTEVLKLYEAKAKEIGAKKLRLHVFAHNQGAKKLYEKMGFFLTGYNMAKNFN